MTMFMKNSPHLAPGTPVSSFSPFSDYSFSFSIGKCSLLHTLGADATQHSTLSSFSFYAALMLTATPTTRKAPLLCSELNTHCLWYSRSTWAPLRQDTVDYFSPPLAVPSGPSCSCPHLSKRPHHQLCGSWWKPQLH